MKIAFISTYPPFICGIATYTGYLAKALSQNSSVDLVVISEGGQNQEGDTFPVHNDYSRRTCFKQNILRRIDEDKPDLIHLQHAPDLFHNSQELISLFEEISKREVKLVVTVHTADTGKNFAIDWKEFYTTILKFGHIIVHNTMSIGSLNYYNLSVKQVHVIAHGTDFPDLPAKVDARKKLGFNDDNFIFLVLGFIHALKNHHTIIRAFNRIKNRKNVRLLIAGTARGGMWYNKLYILVCRLLGLLNRNIVYHNHFIEDGDMADYLAASDVLLLPYWQKYPSASGIFHLAIGSRIGIICSDSAKFSEVKNHMKKLDKLMFIPMLSISKWAKAMSVIIEDPSQNREIQDRLYEYAEKTSWEKIAKEHLALYQSVIGSGEDSSSS